MLTMLWALAGMTIGSPEASWLACTLDKAEERLRFEDEQRVGSSPEDIAAWAIVECSGSVRGAGRLIFDKPHIVKKRRREIKKFIQVHYESQVLQTL